MSTTGIYVCNYNKREYVVRCVESLLKQSYQDRDIYVVDNASTDGSAEALKERFSKQISVIQNEENVGGSGGFDAAIQDALKKDYQYLVLCDNDVWVGEDTIQVMQEYMEAHPDVGILGPKVLQMEKPELIQDFGGSINERYRLVGNYSGRRDADLPDELECDYISTCTAMARIQAVRQFGSMPKENFIYWDDVEWSKRCQNSGYKTVAIGRARVWHNFAEAEDPSAFVRYYMTRNQLKFFSKFLPSHEIPAFYECMLDEIHAKCFMLLFKKRYDLSETIHNAWEDFLNGIEGKAGEGKILPESVEPDSLSELLTEHSALLIEINGKQEELLTLLRLINRIKREGRENQLSIQVKDMERFRQNVADYTNGALYDKLEFVPWGESCGEDIPAVCLCEDIKRLQPGEAGKVFIDRFLNCIASKEDYQYIQAYEASYQKFRRKYERAFEKRIQELREKRVKCKTD